MLKLESGTGSRPGAGGGAAPPVSVVNFVARRMATAELIAPLEPMRLEIRPPPRRALPPPRHV